MPQPQPAADRPADGSTPVPGQDRDPAVTEGATAVSVPSDAAPVGDPADGQAGEPVTAPTSPAAPTADEAAPATRITSPSPDPAPAEQADSEPTRAEPPAAPDPTRMESAAGPHPTRIESTREQPAPRWSGSAAVPPPPPRKRGWGESAEPTPLPPVPSPEHQVPVDPWAGADTGGWDLPSTGFPALPPTLPYTAPHQRPPVTPSHPVPPVTPPPVVPAAPAPPVVTNRPAPAPPLPASPTPAPPTPARPPKQRRRATPPPVTPPPGWQAPRGYVPVPVRRRRRWPWLLLLTVACCCGVPLWWAQPLTTQYPASAALPEQALGLSLRDDPASRAAADELEAEVRASQLLSEDTFAGVYTTTDGKRVTLFGGTGIRFTPETDADDELTRLTERYALAPAVPVETGVRGRYERCAVGREDGAAVVVCTSVDHGSIATAVFTRLSLDDSAALLDRLRQRVVTPDQSS
ncbi:hypothetical protein [Micromonospora mirobrigensis]|uniref:Uncharacterized protein n=1 Tax=Micromonospora mirobrigensis TaxID=262898 RepID=A0A1C5APG9_9ACTN|nr:hypothetical protein [Micromonospora mirobrigensis]SCF47090.1 hypothetical protein GA0070564_11618 [Micromonospora mirobrigensis]